MDVEITHTGPLERAVQIQVGEDQVTDEEQQVLRRLKSQVQVKGFRPGKVPEREIHRRYGKKVRRDVISTLIQKSLAEALDRDDLKAVLYLSPPEIVDDSGAGGFTFCFTAEVKPEAKPTGYLGLVLDVEEPSIGEKEVDQEIERLREGHATIEPVEDRKVVEKDDLVTVTYKPVEEGAAELSAQQAVIDLSDEGIAEGFADGLIGMEVDATQTIKVGFPSGRVVAEKSGTEQVELKVTVHGIKKKTLPVLDELVDLVGEGDSLAQLRENIEKQLTMAAQRQFRNQRRQALENLLLSKTEFDLPPAFLDSRVEEEFGHRMREFKRAGIKPEALGVTSETIREQIRDGVERRIRMEFILSAVAEREKVEITEKELSKAIEDLSKAAGPSGAQLKKVYRSPENRSGLKERLRLDKTLDFLLSKATLASDVDQPAGTPSPDGDAGSVEETNDTKSAEGSVSDAADSEAQGEPEPKPEQDSAPVVDAETD